MKELLAWLIYSILVSTAMGHASYATVLWARKTRDEDQARVRNPGPWL
jgi:hypothetical protein